MRAKGLWLAESFTADLGGLSKLIVLVGPDDSVESGAESDRTIARATATSELRPTHKVASMFDSLRKGRLPEPPVDLAGASHYVASDGRITDSRYVVAEELMPDPWREFVRAAHGELSDALGRVVRVLRWRTSQDGPHQPLSFRSLRWSIDGGESWTPVGLAGSVEVSSRTATHVAGALAEDVLQIVLEGGDEPLGHILFREAWEHRHRSPRSALVIGLAAAEVAVKQFLAERIPDAEWLLQELPMPPVPRLVEEFLPRFVEGVMPRPGEDLVSSLRVAANLRNKVAHAGKSVNYEQVATALSAVRTLLRLLDTYSGHEWARERLETGD